VKRLLSIDPGISPTSGTGWALFHQSGSSSELRVAGLARPSDGELVVRCRGIVEQVIRGIGDIVLNALVLEHMVVYPLPRMKGDPNDLLALAVLEGVFLGLPVPTSGVHLLPARAWKGQVPKEVIRDRIEAALAQPEREVLKGALAGVNGSVRHNVYDAVGLGLYALGRLHQ
jgi:hypothetical protein